MRNHGHIETFAGIECDNCKESWPDLPGFVAHLDEDGNCPNDIQETIP